ncbi:MAG TPA: HD domain-containing phosphohydrolase [Candidatus Deferrimicrobium sp.]|nr:HD domain-containing phosphohydrolase [Candidatus Deferrimicrobium sp.]
MNLKKKYQQAIFSSPYLFLIVTILSIFLTESLIMYVMYPSTSFIEGNLDSIILSILITPALYVLLYRPMMIHLNLSKRIEKQLVEFNNDLELKVLQRTAELEQLNQLFKAEYIEALRLSEEKYKNVMESLGVGVVVVNREMQVISANSHMLKWRPKLLDSNNYKCYEVFIGEDRITECDECPVRSTFKNRQVNEGIVKRRIAGEERVHKIIASPIVKEGKVIAVTEVVQDITLDKQNNENLERLVQERNVELGEAERRYRSLVQNSSEGIFVFDPYTRQIQEANKQLLKMLGYTGDEIASLTVDDIVLANAEDIEGYVQRLVNGENVFVTRQYKRKDKTLLDVEVSGSLIQYGKANVILVNVRDITERKQSEEALKQSIYDLKRTLEAGVDALVYVGEKRDPYTAGHQSRVSMLACSIAEEMGFGQEVVENVRFAGALHDIGKLYIPTDILNKPGRLTEMELAIIKTHSDVGYEIVKKIPFKNPIAEIVLQHHERMNGTGYPKGLLGKEMLVEAKILAVADVVEAMSSHRPYRPAIGFDSALKEITDNQGTLYDTEVVNALIRLSKGGRNFENLVS